MEYSNEAIELVESVLSSVNESERWQYRYADLLNKKKDDLNKKIENEKKKIEYYGKDPSKLKELKVERDQIPKVNNNRLMNYRKGTKNGIKLDPKADVTDDEIIRDRHKAIVNKPDLYNPFTDTLFKKEPENKAMHDRINKRTAAFDTTAKHEAAMILIEALNTLLNE